jgi:hypothetical protein
MAAASSPPRYLYEDSSAALQGPFSEDEMRAWHAAGYLPADLRVRLESESEFCAIRDRSPPFAFTIAAAEPAAASSAAAASSSSSSSSSADSSHSAPASKRAKLGGGDEQTAADDTGDGDGGDEDEDEGPVEDKDRMWFYQDKEGKTRGPFVGTQLKDWFVAGYFPPETPIRAVRVV